MDLPKEILNAKPRPGGAVKINEDSDISMAVLEKLLKKNANNDDSDIQKEDDPLNISRRCKIKQAVTFTPWNYMETREKEGTIKPNPKQNVMDLLSTTIGAVMCLATNSNCPQQNLKWAFSYLDLIKDEYGQSPPNVQGILNHIQQVARGIKSYLNKSGEEQANVAVPAEEEPPAETEEVPPTEESPEEEPEPE